MSVRASRNLVLIEGFGLTPVAQDTIDWWITTWVSYKRGTTGDRTCNLEFMKASRNTTTPDRSWNLSLNPIVIEHTAVGLSLRSVHTVLVGAIGTAVGIDRVPCEYNSDMVECFMRYDSTG